MSDYKDNRDFIINYGVYGSVGLQLAASVVGGVLLGIWGDNKLGSSPWCMVIGVVLGSAGGFYNLLKILNWHQERKKK